MVGALLVALVSSADDYFGGIPLAPRLIVHLVAAGLVVFHAGELAQLPLPAPANLSTGILSAPLAIIWIVGVTNLYNFLDGIDGSAACQGIIAGLASSLLFPNTGIASAGLAIAGACGGFLVFNWHPARIYLGDVGSITLGFIFASLPFQAQSYGRGRSTFLVAICLWVFLADGAFTLMRRLSRGEKIWIPHLSHIYQRLAKMGLRHDEVVLTTLAFSVPITILAVVAGTRQSAALDWGVFALAFASFAGYVLLAVRMESRALSRPQGHPTESMRSRSDGSSRGESREDFGPPRENVVNSMPRREDPPIGGKATR